MSARPTRLDKALRSLSSQLRRLTEKYEEPSGVNVDVKVSFEGTPYVTRDTAALSPREFRKLAQRVMREHKVKRPG